MAKYAIIEFLFDGEHVCVLGVNMYYGYSFYLDLKPINGGWMGVFRVGLISKWVSIYVLYCVKTCHGAHELLSVGEIVFHECAYISVKKKNAAGEYKSKNLDL